MEENHKSRNIQIGKTMVSDLIHSVVHSDPAARIPMNQHITCYGGNSCEYHFYDTRCNSNGNEYCGLHHDTLQTAEES